jgi:hypothetical protein
MQYLLIDAHKRFLGTLDSEEALSVGDTFQNDNNQTYAVVGLNWSLQRNRNAQSLTVIRVNSQRSENN